MMWGYGFNWLTMTLMMLGSTLWIVLLGVLVWAVIRWLNTRAVSPNRQAQMLPGSGFTAVEIVRQRYARGEIDATAFEQMQERLGAAENAHQRSQAEVAPMRHGPQSRQTVGEKLFD
ncbi:MAG: hypothetical protein PVS3B3_20940 [Ktedonobacteraceae bacterium]